MTATSNASCITWNFRLCSAVFWENLAPCPMFCWASCWHKYIRITALFPVDKALWKEGISWGVTRLLSLPLPGYSGHVCFPWNEMPGSVCLATKGLCCLTYLNKLNSDQNFTFLSPRDPLTRRLYLVSYRFCIQLRDALKDSVITPFVTILVRRED